MDETYGVVETMNSWSFVDAFRRSSRKDQFSDEALRIIFDDLEQMAEEMQHNIEFCPVDICCMYSEYESFDEWVKEECDETYSFANWLRTHVWTCVDSAIRHMLPEDKGGHWDKKVPLGWVYSDEGAQTCANLLQKCEYIRINSIDDASYLLRSAVESYSGNLVTDQEQESIWKMLNSTSNHSVWDILCRTRDIILEHGVKKERAALFSNDPKDGDKFVANVLAGQFVDMDTLCAELTLTVDGIMDILKANVPASVWDEFNEYIWGLWHDEVIEDNQEEWDRVVNQADESCIVCRDE